MKIKLSIALPTEALFLKTACEDRYNKVVEDELLWDAWELSAQKRFIKQLDKFLLKWGIR